jgi:type II secretory pathway pseudopilin PulG
VNKQNRLFSRHCRASGYTIIELSIIMAVLAIISTCALLWTNDLEEVRDASQVQTVQAAMQNVINQAATRLDVAPTALNRASVVNAVQSNQAGLINLVPNATGWALTLPNSGRGATFAINNGRLVVTSTTRFNKYGVDANGLLSKR